MNLKFIGLTGQQFGISSSKRHAHQAFGLPDANSPMRSFPWSAIETEAASTLIPSQLELSYTLKNPSQKEHLLANFISEMETNYDLIITDCAPTKSILTTAAYLASDSILIPVKPEFLSTIGLPLIQQSLGNFSKLYRKSLAVTGVCFNHSSEYAPEATTSKREVRQVCDNFGWHVFDQEIPYSRSFSKRHARRTAVFQRLLQERTKAAEVADFCRTRLAQG